MSRPKLPLFTADPRADAVYDKWGVVCCTRAAFRLWWRPGTRREEFCEHCPTRKECDMEDRR